MNRFDRLPPDADPVVLRFHPPGFVGLRCRFGCDPERNPVIGIYHMPAGCVCWSDQVQALCAQHFICAESTGPIVALVIMRELARFGSQQGKGSMSTQNERLDTLADEITDKVGELLDYIKQHADLHDAVVDSIVADMQAASASITKAINTVVPKTADASGNEGGGDSG